MKVLVLADVGQAAYHVGDEGLGIAAGQALSARGLVLVYATRDIEHSRAFIDADAEFVSTLKFPWPPAERELYLEQLRAHCAGAPAPAEIERFLADVRSVDAVLIAGGGNMNSRYGWLLYERAAFALAAQAAGIPLVVSGQSFGPVLSDFDAEVLEGALSSARAVCARERGSYTWAVGRGLAVHAGIDDASFYVAGDRSLGGAVPDLPERYVCATFNGLDDEQVVQVASVLDEFYGRYGVPTVFLPHMGVPEYGDGDVALHERVAGLMSSPAVVLPMVHVDVAARVHRGAVLGFSTRYHPAVFSLAAGVPFVGLLPDAFTDQRVRGAMAHFGFEDFALPLVALSTSVVLDALVEVFESRLAIAEHLTERSAVLSGFAGEYWDAVVSLLAGKSADLPLLPPVGEQFTASGAWCAGILPWRDALAAASLAAQSAEAALDRALTWNAVHRGQRDRAVEQVVVLEHELACVRSAGVVESSRGVARAVKRSVRSRFSVNR